jgi:hypothetical protein
VTLPRLKREQMLAQIRQRLSRGEPVPTDAEMMDHFGLVDAAPVRLFLSDLADQGAITIVSWDEPRHILLGRIRKEALASAPRPAPAVKRADLALDRGVEKIMAIASRGTSAKQVATNAAALLGSVTPAAKPAPAKPAPKKETAPMPAKTICLPASHEAAQKAVDELATTSGIPLGQAAGDLIMRGLAVAAVPLKPQPLPLGEVHLDALLAEVRARFDRAPNADELDAAITRAERAEAKIEQLKAVFA